ncbi:myotubularin isoform X2 [Pseudomonas phage vB_PaeM_C1-14_Ab28]|uniref:myotubularin isoform X2 n=1 Tax=Pseudomonas phage vB_PaeM_C1-14_Ab28 TaxID=1548917 RepID=UPI0018C30562|nr:myotubularin isoform X2 [Pseudomonas phage vB_PaeM_C1-14_Ab28]
MKAADIINCASADEVAEARELVADLEAKGHSREFIAKAKADLALVESHNLPFATAPEDDDYADLPNEDGINEDGQNVFHPGCY